MTEQIKGVHNDMLAFQARTEQRLDNVDGHLERVEGRLGRVEKGLADLRDDMPGIVGAAMREVLREDPGKPRKKP